MNINMEILESLLRKDDYLYPDHGVFWPSLVNLFSSSDSENDSQKMIYISLEDNRIYFRFPPSHSRAQKDHSILILSLLLMLSSSSEVKLNLLNAHRLTHLLSSDAEKYRASLA